MNQNHTWLSVDRRVLCLTAAFSAVLLGTRPAHATILTFTSPSGVFAGNNSVVYYPQSLDPSLPVYGDHVTNSISGTPSYPSAYSYGNNGEGFTPNVGISYSPGSATAATSASNPFPVYYPNNFGDLSGVIYQVDTVGPTDTNNLTLGITLTTDPNHVVKLLGFDLAAWNGSANNLDSLQIIVDGQPTVLGTNLTIPNSNNHTNFNFTSSPFVGNTIELLLDGRDTSHYGGSVSQAYFNFTDIGIDNIVFAQAVPEPSTILLIGVGGLWLSRALRNRRRNG